MQYISTRGKAPALSFIDCLLTGLAPDGGLYLPKQWPHFSFEDLKGMQTLSYKEIALRVITPFIGDEIPQKDLKDIIDRTYSHFDHKAIAPLQQMDDNIWLVKLIYGPTFAFKDYALQLLGNLFDYVLEKQNKSITVVGATSGDTGSAAIYACKNSTNIRSFILHPYGRTSDIQRRQMTTVIKPNVTNIAVHGSFDDCQALVKAIFNDKAFNKTHHLCAVNSINWVRIMAQIIYYVYACLKLGAPTRQVRFAVPTGNFGNIFAAFCAKKIGLPINHLIIGSNKNDILTRFFSTGTLEAKPVKASLSPSMDIQISSNFERFLFELFDRDSSQLTSFMENFSQQKKASISKEKLHHARTLFSAYRFDDEQTLQAIKTAYQQTNTIIDPHTAIGLSAAQKNLAQGAPDPITAPIIAMETAHPAKFGEAIQRALGFSPPLPPALKALENKQEKYHVIDARLSLLKAIIEKS